MAETAKQRLERLSQLESSGQLVPPARERLEQLRAMDLVDKSPFEIPAPDPVVAASLASEFDTDIDTVTPEARELAAQGVDVISGSPVGRLAAGFAQNEALQAQDLKKRLSKHFGRDIKVLKGPLGLEYINPETNRRTLVDEQTTIPTRGDLADLAGPALPISGAVVGEVVGNVPGAAVGAALGEGARRGIGNLIEVRDETAGEAARGAAGAAIIEGTAAKAGEVATRAAQGVKRFFRPEPIDATTAQRILDESEDSQAIADEISRRTGERFQPRTSQLSRDTDLLQADEVVRRSGRFGPEIRARQVQNETTLERFFDEVNPSGPVENTQIGRAVQNEARQQTRPRVEAAQDTAQGRLAELERLTAELPKASDAQIRADLSAQASQSLKILKEEHEDVAWNEARQLMGYNPDTALSDVKIPIDGGLAGTLRRIQVEASEAIDPTVASGKTALVPEGLTQGDIDLNQLQVHLGQLKRRLRLARQGEVITDPQGRDISRVVNDLQLARDNYLREANPALLEKLRDAEALTARRAALFDNSITGKLVRKENGEYQLTDKQLVAEAIGSGDRESIQHLVSALDNHPAGIPTLKKSFLAFYRNEVVRDGVPDAARHKVFVENNREALDALFPGNNKVKVLGELEREATRGIKRFENFQKAVDKSFRGRIQSLAPERVAEDIFSKGFSNKDVGRLMNLAESAGFKREFQTAVGNHIRRIHISETSGINMNTLSKFMGKNQDRLARVFGGGYVRDMNMLLKGLSDVRTSGAGIQVTTKPTMIGALAEALARVTVARPLSPGGVALTRAKGARQIAAERVLANVIQEPDALRAIVANRNTPLQTQRVARILSVLGGGALLDEENAAERALDAVSEQ